MSASSQSSSFTNIFPTTTASSTPNNNSLGGQNPTTYYFVFLGVLVVLLVIAATLSFRAFRIRRRYRSAAQLALMRGEPLPPSGHDDYWGFGTMGWRAMPVGEGGDEVDRILDRGGRGGKRGPWSKIPELREVEVDQKTEEGVWLEDCQPITLHSLLPVSKPSDNSTTTEAAGRLNTAPSSNRYQFSGIRRQFLDSPFSRPTDSSLPPQSVHPSQPTTEIQRQVEIGEEVRVAIVIRMPRDPVELEDEKRRSLVDDDEDEDEERPGWESGMELGVWEGQAGR